MVELAALVAYTDQLLESSRFADYCPNGLQVEGRREIRRIVSGVTASRDLIEEAVAQQADLLLVHHGFFWKGEDPRVVGPKAARLGLLLRHNITLLAYHLPLDAHSELGNNAGLARVLGLMPEGRFGTADLAMHGAFDEPLTAEQVAGRLGAVLGRQPLLVKAGERLVRRLGWCSGAAQDYLERAAALGLDGFVSGEISERTWHDARELDIHYFAAGHHATERLGVQALGEHLAAQFGLEHRYVEIPNPV